MTTYHVGCGEISGRIYAGTVNKKGDKWLQRTDVTDEAIRAVRDHLLNFKNQKEQKDAESVGYQWATNDGKAVSLMLKFDDEPAKEKESEKE